jgi:hypothetical protein
MAPSSPVSRPFVLATLRALRLDPGCGCRTRPKHAGNDLENGRHDHKHVLSDAVIRECLLGFNAATDIKKLSHQPLKTVLSRVRLASMFHATRKVIFNFSG